MKSGRLLASWTGTGPLTLWKHVGTQKFLIEIFRMTGMHNKAKSSSAEVSMLKNLKITKQSQQTQLYIEILKYLK